MQDRLQSLPHQHASTTDLIRGNESDSSHLGTAAEADTKLSTATSSKTDDDYDNDQTTLATADLDVSTGSTRASEEPTGTATGKWSDMDFPPLSATKEQSKVEHGVWSEKMPPKHASPRS